MNLGDRGDAVAVQGQHKQAGGLREWRMKVGAVEAECRLRVRPRGEDGVAAASPPPGDLSLERPHRRRSLVFQWRRRRAGPGGRTAGFGLGRSSGAPRASGRDAALTLRAKKNSRLSAVVVRFSRARKRYERQGILVAEDALELIIRSS